MLIPAWSEAVVRRHRADLHPDDIEAVNRVEIAQGIVIKTTGATYLSDILRACGAVSLATRNDINAPVEVLVDDALRILGAHP